MGSLDLHEDHEKQEFDFGTWAERVGTERRKLNDYLISPEEFSPLWIKRELLTKGALRPIATSASGNGVDINESRGANMEVYFFVADGLKNLLIDWYKMRHGGEDPDASTVERITGFSSMVERAFVFKVGNTRDYIVRLSNDVKVFSRDHMHQAFDKLGFPIKNDRKRVDVLAADVATFNGWAGNEKESSVKGPCLVDEFLRFIDDPTAFGEFRESEHFIREDGDRDGSKIEAFYQSRIPESSSTDKALSYQAYAEIVASHRRFDPAYLRREFQKFVDEIVTYGFWDSVRFLTSYNKHTDLTYEQFEAIVERCYQLYGDESFVYPEQTTFGYDPRESQQGWSEIISDNEKVAHDIAEYCRQNLPENLRPVFSDDKVLEEFCYKVLEHYHSIPEYEVSSARSFLSITMVQFLIDAAYLLVFEPESDRRFDFKKNQDLLEIFSSLSREQLINLLFLIWKALATFKGRRDKKLCTEFHRFEKTQVKTQQRLDYGGEDAKRVVMGPVSIAEFMENKDNLAEAYGVDLNQEKKLSKEIFGKLVVYYNQVCRFYRDTGWVPDKRPDNVAKYVFLFGEWAMRTNNLQIIVFEMNDGSFVTRVTNIDPEDHFADLRRVDAGLAKGGFNLVPMLGGPALKKAALRMVDEFARLDGIEGDKLKWSLMDRTLRYIVGFLEDRVEKTDETRKFVLWSLREGIDHIRERIRRRLESFQKTEK